MTQKSKIIITGATGWLGKCAINYLINTQKFLDFEIILFSSKKRNFQIKNMNFQSDDFLNYDLNDLKDHEIKGIIHLAFLTRDKIEVLGFNKYVSINQEITNKLRELVDITKPSWLTTVSSGASTKDNDEISINPYGVLKLEEEQVISSFRDLNWSVARLWGAMGAQMPINRNYAVSDFICQALLNGEILVQAKTNVFRRYVSDEEFLETCIESAITGVNKTFDSGGDLVEIRNLAKMVAAVAGGVKVKATEPLEPPDEYFPRNDSYEQIRKALDLAEIRGLNELVLETFLGHKAQLVM